MTQNLGKVILFLYFAFVAMDTTEAAAVRGSVSLHKKMGFPDENPYARNNFRTDLRFSKWHLKRRFESTRLKDYGNPTDAIIYLSSIPEPYRMQDVPTQTPSVVCIENARFHPRTIPVMQGGAIEFVNKDPVYHDVYSFSAANAFQTPFFRELSAFSTFKKPGGVVLHSSVYEDMQAHVLVLEHPWFTKPRDNGYYHIRNIRPGIYKITAWHPDFPPITKDIEINYSETITLDFHFSVAELPEAIVKE